MCWSRLLPEWDSPNGWNGQINQYASLGQMPEGSYGFLKGESAWCAAFSTGINYSIICDKL